MTADRAYTATFAINNYTLDVSTVGNGVVTRTPDQPGYDFGSVVTLRATPDEGWHFVGWSGDTTETADSLVVTMESNRTYTATFAINEYTLDVSAGTGGSVTREPDQATYDHGSVVTVRAVPDTGWHFTGWSGDTTETADSLVVTMLANRSYTATFAINEYTLTVTAEGNGSIGVSPQMVTYPHGTEVLLTANPNPTNLFVEWYGDTIASTPTLPLTMTRDRTIIGTFTIKLTVSVLGSGHVDVVPDQALYVPYDEVTLTAVADIGQRFVGWEGDTVATDNPIDVLLLTDFNVQARFESSSAAQVAGIDATARVSLEPPRTPWTVGEEADIRWLASTPGGRVDLWLARGEGAFEPIAEAIPDGGYRWSVTGPEAAEARLAVRLTLPDGRQADDTVHVEIVEPVRAFAFGPIAPNPTRGAATFDYAVPRTSRVRLSLHDVQGREVAVIVDRVAAPGRYHETWDSRQAGRPVSPGVYFVRFQYPGNVIVRRLTISH